MTSTTPLVELRNVSFGYGERVILRDVSLQVPRGKVTARNAQGQPLRMMGVHMDVQQRVAQERLLYALMDRFPSGILLADPQAQRIRGAMLDEVRKGDWAPRSVHRNTRMVSDAIRVIEAKTGCDAKDHEVAAELQLSLDDYYGILNDTLGSRLFSFDDLLQDGEHEGLHEDGASAHLEPSRDLEDERFQGALADAIANLPERERLVLALYYDEELNLKEIGEVLGVSESRVSQLHSQCAARLRARLGEWRVS